MFPCVARGFKACASIMFIAYFWWRSLAVDGGSRTSRGYALGTLVLRSPGARRRPGIIAWYEHDRLIRGHGQTVRTLQPWLHARPIFQARGLVSIAGHDLGSSFATVRRYRQALKRKVARAGSHPGSGASKRR